MAIIHHRKVLALLAASSLGWFAAAWPLPTRADPSSLPSLPLRFAVAPWPDADTHPQAWIDQQIHQANRIFAKAGLTFQTVERVPLDASHAHLRTRVDRHRLGAAVAPHVVNCFVVNSLGDVDEPGRLRQGVHWRSRHHAGVHYVILSAQAGPDVLAHELGHFFGNREHSDVPGNIMSYTRGPDLPFLDAGQIGQVRRFAQRFLDKGELKPAQALVGSAAPRKSAKQIGPVRSAPAEPLTQ